MQRRGDRTTCVRPQSDQYNDGTTAPPLLKSREVPKRLRHSSERLKKVQI